MIDLHVNFDTEPLRLKFSRLRVSVQAATEQILDELAAEGVSRWQILASETVRSGRYWRGISVKERSPGRRVIGPSADREQVAIWLERGTRKHRIPRSGEARLSFFWAKGPSGPGIYRFGHVMHPGTRPYRHARQTAQFVRSVRSLVARRGINRAIEERIATIRGGI